MATALPPALDFTGSGVSQDAFKASITQLREFLNSLLGADGVPLTARLALGTMADLGINTRLIFQQASAPVGWTKETNSAYNDAAIRLATSPGAPGGADAFSTHFGTSKTTSSKTLAQAELPNVSFPVTDPGHPHLMSFDIQFLSGGGAPNVLVLPGFGVGTTAYNSGSATTGISVHSGGSGTAFTIGLPNFNIKYVDHIIATKDANG